MGDMDTRLEYIKANFLPSIRNLTSLERHGILTAPQLTHLQSIHRRGNGGRRLVRSASEQLCEILRDKTEAQLEFVLSVIGREERRVSHSTGPSISPPAEGISLQPITTTCTTEVGAEKGN